MHPSGGDPSLRWGDGNESLLSLLRRRNPAVDLLFQHRKRERAGAQHLFVEGADVELGAKLRLRLFAQPLDGERADLIGKRLAGDRDLAFDFRRRIGAAHV